MQSMRKHLHPHAYTPWHDFLDL